MFWVIFTTLAVTVVRLLLYSVRPSHFERLIFLSYISVAVVVVLLSIHNDLVHRNHKAY